MILLPEVIITGNDGQRVQITFANSSPSMLPGMHTSVITRATADEFTKITSASSADAQSKTRKPSSKTASTTIDRNISSSSTTSTVNDMFFKSQDLLT